MAESEKGASSSAKAKEKSSLLGDMDFGKDFFTSWGSTTSTGDDGVDFDFGTVAKGKKKAFNFDKLDVDFSLDGDLDKMSSFKVDMSDLDISSPLKKSGTKERSKEESGNGNHQSKKDSFSFSFDFNEFDTLEFEPSTKREASKVSKNGDDEDLTNKKECEGSRTEQRNGAGPFDSLNSNTSASEGMTISNVKTTARDLEKTDFTDHSLLPLESRADDIGNSKPPTNPKLVELDEEVTLPKSTSSNNADETVQDTICQQETTFERSYSPESTHDCSIKSVSEDLTTQVDYSELPAEVSSWVTKDDVGKQNTNIDSVAAPELESPLLDPSVAKSGSDDTNICGDNDTISIGNKDVSQPAQADVDSADTSSSNTSRKSICVKESSTEHQNGKSEGRVSSPNSGTSKLIGINENESSIVRSKFFKRSDGRESQRRQYQSSQTARAMLPANLMGSKQQTDGRKVVSESKDPQGENKVSSESASLSGEISKGESAESGRSDRVLKDIGSLLNGRKPACSKLNEKVVREEPIRRLDKNTKTLVTLSSSSKSPCSTEQLPKLTAPVQVTPRAVLNTVSIKSSVNISGEGNKVSTIKANRSLPDLSSLRISRTSGASHCLSNSSVQKQTNSSINLKQIGELAASAPSNIFPNISTEKPSRSSPSLKRKTYEASNLGTLTTKPLKRLSQSPVESRNIKELLMDVNKEASNVDMLKSKPLKRFSQLPTESRSVEEVLMDVNKEGGNNLVMAENHNSDYLQSPTLNIAQEVNSTDFNMALVVERDDNVEKAEAYTKDLDDMCHALKKKLEEAKELLVRAVVNGYNLLMLNHPIYEETIFKIQKLNLQQMSEDGSRLISQTHNSFY